MHFSIQKLFFHLMLPYIALLHLVHASVPILQEAYPENASSIGTMPGPYTSRDIMCSVDWCTTEGTFPRDGSSNYPGCCSEDGDSFVGNTYNSETHHDDSGTPHTCVCV